MGTRLNWQTAPRRRQFEHVSIPVSALASHRTYFKMDAPLVGSPRVTMFWDVVIIPSCAGTRRRPWKFSIVYAHFVHHS